MAYKSDDVQEIVTSLNIGRDNELRVCTIKAKDTLELKSIDIRQWFTNDNGEKCPGKGIRIKEEFIGDIIVSLITNCNKETLTDILCDHGITIEIPDED